MMQAPVTVLQTNTRRDTGKKAQYGNILAAKAVADIVRTTLGPRAMLKMLLDANGGIVLTNDGNAILREIDVSHPAAKSIIELSRTQDEAVGDGTTSVIILAGEMLAAAEPFLERNLHPTVIIRAYMRALEDALRLVDAAAFPIDVQDRDQMLKIVNSCIGTKFTQRLGNLVADLALDAVQLVKVDVPGGTPEIDLKKWAKVEKIPGASLEDSRVLRGVMFEKDVVVPGRMRRKIANPRILLLDCPLEYKKGENQTNVELAKEEDWAALLKLEEDWVARTCAQIAALKPDLVITEKGLSDLAAHYLTKAGISAIRRLRKTDNNRIARAAGATIVSRPDEATERDIGTGAGLFEVRKIGDEFWTFIVDCEDPKACSIVLRGASKDVLNEVERNLHDAMGVARNVVLDPRLVPGGGAVEMAVSHGLAELSTAGGVLGNEQAAYRAVGAALEVIPRTLASNCGANVIRTISKLRAAHAEKSSSFGINGNTGKVEDMRELGVWEPYEVKAQTLKTAVEAATLLLRIDDIVSGLKKRGGGGGKGGGVPQVDSGENVDSEHMLQE
ncbi:CCT3 [Auxenochlorella protothecoides x Auxenochlorella symbiontica]|uniref:T-complex protein 1 subunit gamma n=1 Tax=Auxenochlorella protothecoides TaxID=3075 RepID=A0A087SD63_AUXPR|nr:T-complex protein 1 subunit gamma [Auxenochlorella protothecoides]KFM23667.1 T-complex protein 1 subunit gamma [Auxenochlorella protothecoides]